MDDSDEDSEEGSEDEEGDGGGREDKAPAAAAAAAEVGPAVEGSEAVGVRVGAPDAAAPVKERDGNVFASRIAAHAECTRRLWRARYLAMRDVSFFFFLIRFTYIPYVFCLFDVPGIRCTRYSVFVFYSTLF